MADGFDQSKLGGLPSLGYGPATLQPQPIAYDPNAGHIWNQLADEAQSIGQKFQPELDERAAAQGAASVTRDANGNLTAPPDRPTFTQADAAYANAAKLRYINETALDIQPKIAALQQQHANDPQGFASSLDGLVTGAVQNAPPQFQEDIQGMILKQGQAAQETILKTKLARDTDLSQQATDTSIEVDRNALFGYARQNNMDDPQAQFFLSRLQANIRAKAGNPIFNYSQAQGEQDLAELQSQLKGQAVIGRVDQLYAQYGEAASEREAEKLLDDPALNLSPQERITYAGQARQEIRILHSMTTQNQWELQRQIEYRLDDANAAALSTGDYSKVLSSDDIYRAYASNPQRAAQIVGKLNASTEIYSMNKSVAMATPSELAEMNQKLNPATNGSGTVPSDFNSIWSRFTLPHEGGYVAKDGNGSPANFGINQGENPDVDVKNLTQDQAAKIAKDRYYTASGADKLPPGLSAVQFDTAFNMGTGEANKLLAASGGDANKYLDLREQQYRAIAAKNPDQAANLPGWLARNTDLKNFISGGDIADQSRVYAAFHEAVARRNTEIVKDPAAYVLNARPDLSQALASNDPATVQNGVRSMLAVERDIGVAKPTLISKPEAQAIIGAFENPSDPTKRADGMNSIIDGLAQRYGQYFPDVMRSLQQDGMPPEATALYTVRGNGGAAARMATAINAIGQMGKDMNSGRDAFFKGAPGNTDIEKAIPGVMGDYTSSFVGNPDGPVQIQSMRAAVNLYAHQLGYEGKDPNTAANQAYKDLIGSRYNMVDSYRVPTGIDQGAVEAGANAIKTSLGGTPSAPAPLVAIPKGSGSEDSGLSPQDVLARNTPFMKPGVSNFTTQLPASDEKAFQAWVKKNNVPFDPNSTTPDYDMRGFWKGLQSGDPVAKTAINPNDKQMHFPDKWKTPYDLTFSAESQFANPSAPKWNDKDQLVTPGGQVVFDDKARTYAPKIGGSSTINLEPYAEAGPGVSVDDRRAMSAQILKGQGIWATSRDDKGLQLLWPQATGYLPALDSRGRPLFFSWGDLTRAGQGAKPSVSQVDIDSARYGAVN